MNMSISLTEEVKFVKALQDDDDPTWRIEFANEAPTEDETEET